MEAKANSTQTPPESVNPIPTRTVIIPACAEHAGYHDMTVTLLWVCPECGGPRGEPFMGLSYDGSRRMNVHCWINPCGHIDYYAEVRKEARALESEHDS